MDTTVDSIRILGKSIITRLENQNAIEMNSSKRKEVIENLFSILRPHIMTHEDVREKTLERIKNSAEQIAEADVTESRQYQIAKKVVQSEMGEDELNGFYFQKPLKSIAQDICKHLMDSPQIEEVFETDEDLEKAIIQIVQKFKLEEQH